MRRIPVPTPILHSETLAPSKTLNPFNMCYLTHWPRNPKPQKRNKAPVGHVAPASGECYTFHSFCSCLFSCTCNDDYCQSCCYSFLCEGGPFSGFATVQTVLSRVFGFPV